MACGHACGLYVVALLARSGARKAVERGTALIGGGGKACLRRWWCTRVADGSAMMAGAVADSGGTDATAEGGHQR